MPKTTKPAKATNALEFLKTQGNTGVKYNYPVIFKNEEKIMKVLPGASVSDKKGVRKTFRKICTQVAEQFKEVLPTKPQATDLKKLFSLFGMSKEDMTKKLESKVVAAIWA